MNRLKNFQINMRPNLDIMNVLDDLNPIDKGNYYLLKCPQCGEQEAFLYKDSDYIICNRLNNCGYSESIIHYLGNGDFGEGVTIAAQLAGVDYDPAKFSSMGERQYRLQEVKVAANRHFFETLEREGSEYLKKREVQPDKDIGLYDKKTLSVMLYDRFDKDLVDETNLIDSRLDGRIMITFRDRYKQIMGFSGRIVE
jgi:DNA primase